MFKGINRGIWILGLVSLFTDLSSEMLYPVMPLFLKSVGVSFIGIGLIEGMAEAIAGLSKIYFGRLSDLSGNKKLFVSTGYGLSAISKVLLVLASTFPLIFSSRMIDRVGKGIRTAPRDAMLTQMSNSNNEATVFGFHRAMDTIGAVIGPFIALLLLYVFSNEYKYVFMMAAIPAFIGFGITLLIKESKVTTSKIKLSFINILLGRGIESKKYFYVIIPFLLFALVNSSDVFLLLIAKQNGMNDTEVIFLYIIYNLVYALCAYPAGILADIYGKNILLIIGLLFFAIVYVSIFNATTFIQFSFVFIIYGIYAACSEGNVKALISKYLLKEEKASGFGFFAGWQSIALLLASIWTGYLWSLHLQNIAFIISASMALIITIVISFQYKYSKN